MSELTFQWPWALLGLIVLPWLPDWLPHQRAARQLKQVMHPDMLRLFSLGDDASQASRRMRWVIRLMGFCSLVALAGPSLPSKDTSLQVAPRPLIVALDLSLSMYANDINPSRIERARQKLQDILDRVGDRPVGLIAYAGDAFSVVPVTRDHATIELMLPDLSPGIMPLPGSRPDRALKLARQWAERTGEADMLLITDDLPADHLPAVSHALQNWPGETALLAMGTDAGAPIPIPERGFLQQDNTVIMSALPVRRIEQLASETGLRWQRATITDADISYLLSQTDTELGKTDTDRPLPPRNLGYWFLLPVMLISIRLMPHLGIIACLILMTGLAPTPAQALDLDALWYNRDQRAWQALRHEQFEVAAQLADDPMIKGSALYRAGKYAEAAEAFADVPSAEGHYNRGNALAQSGKIEAARAAYLKALALNPDLEQARRNLELLDQLQPQSSPQPGNGSTQPPQAPNAPNTPQQPSGNAQAQSAPGKGKDKNGQGGPSKDAHGAGGRASPDASADSGNQTYPSPADYDDTGSAGAGRQGADRPSGETSPPQNPHQERSNDLRQAARQPTDTSPGTDSTRGSPHPDSATEIWLRRIPDTPGALLQRKFQLHARERGRRLEEGEPIW